MSRTADVVFLDLDRHPGRSRGLGVDISVDLAHEQGRQPERLISELETTIYRVIQEALTKAQKDGAASRAVRSSRAARTPTSSSAAGRSR